MIPLRALSVRQPWAHAIVHMAKDIENRGRCHGHRGLTLIHASAGMDAEEYLEARQFMTERGLGDLAHPSTFERGGIIGAVDILDCVRSSPSRWFSGPRGYALSNQRPIPFIPCKGTVTPLFWVPAPEVQLQARRALGLPD